MRLDNLKGSLAENQTALITLENNHKTMVLSAQAMSNLGVGEGAKVGFALEDGRLYLLLPQDNSGIHLYKTGKVIHPTVWDALSDGGANVDNKWKVSKEESFINGERAFLLAPYAPLQRETVVEETTTEEPTSDIVEVIEPANESAVEDETQISNF